MSRRNHNDVYWETVSRGNIRDEYERYLTENGLEQSAHNAEIFTMYKGMVGMEKRNTIIELAGVLPPFYD
ncbi:TPA: hypothetical protein ACXJRF_000028 [Serratia marcescens]